MVRGQIEGALVQGIGYALTEELVWDGPRLANPSLMDYKIPTMAEVPLSHAIYIIETQEPTGPYGAKSVGELGINAVAAAVANGIVEATGARLTQLPLSAERVYQALYPQDFA
jgi:CO/xanthine dehydrogenase Mo-binding subunit